ncbi:hypothetical protein ABB37_05999 [Leptomonas pyrrhocoris]|uniref:Sfi1 spindle body domain-containing protein n=1 Tax=Leptomonas pyrrhocoris TaxID=157538 RepID=A0A0M9FYX4_LEPPY|nr:hypothetical protein ABB37_05999 [Leptomonas pyrrhocoris]KPA78935.1 hypothetical protein ABB37_05999 [Leptomonas pyrrhocoris]|eukprot:XP_015657374.1 hypothetical protein ABB37_05999 [Leptomonas pyrrhocoris]
MDASPPLWSSPKGVAEGSSTDVPQHTKSAGEGTASMPRGQATAYARHPALSTTAPSSSNGETLLLHTSDAADLTLNTVHAPAFGDGPTTSIELSPSPSADDSFPRMEDEAMSTPSPTASEIHVDEVADLEEANAAVEAALLNTRDVWTRQVHVGSCSSSSPGGSIKTKSDVLSNAATYVIAQALYRASLLRRCIEKWQSQQERHRHQRQHRELFAEGYYQHNLRYLMFRAWQWRYASVRRRAEATQRAAELRRRTLCQRAFHTWREWRQRQQFYRRLVQALQLEGRAVLREDYVEKWRRWCVRRSQARALERATLQQTRGRYVERWRMVVSERKRRRLLVQVISSHSPAAWAASTEVSTRELLWRYSWIQWLRVTMQRRAARLQYREDCTRVLSAHTTKTHLRCCYTKWLQATFASLQSRQMAKTLAVRSFQRWCPMGTRCLKGNAWVRDVLHPRVLHRCFQQWRDRCHARATQRHRMQLADTFTSSVMNPHAAQRLFQLWHRRWSYQERTRRMRRVAESYARPALLRHLFMRRVTDGVLSSAVDPDDVAADVALWPGDSGNGIGCLSKELPDSEGQQTKLVHYNELQQRPSQRSSLSPAAPSLALASMKPPIPLCPLRAKPREAGTPTGEASKESRAATDASPAQRTIALAAAPSTFPAAQPPRTPTVPAASSPFKSPPPPLPPPSYEEAMRRTPATTSDANASPTQTPRTARLDVGVGTEATAGTTFGPAMCGTLHESKWNKHVNADGGASAASPPPPPPLAQPLSMTEMELPAAPSVPPSYPPHSLSSAAPPCWWPPLHPPLASLWPVIPALPCGVVASQASSVNGGDPQGVGAPLLTCAATAAAAVAANAPATPLFTTARPTEGPHRPPAWPRNAVYPPLRADAHLAGCAPPLAPMPMNGGAPLTPPPRTHDGVHLHRHADPFAPLPPSPPEVQDNSLTRYGAEGAWKRKRKRARRTAWLVESARKPVVASVQHRPHSCVVPLPSPAPLPIVEGRTPAPFATAPEASNAAKQPLRGHTTAVDAPHESGTSSSTSSSSSDALCSTAAAALPESLLPQSIDAAALRATVRDVLDDYNKRTRLLPAEKAELATISSRIELARQLGIATEHGEDGLRKRQRYLQTRILAWQQTRAQVAQLTALLEEKVRVKQSSAASQIGSE